MTDIFKEILKREQERKQKELQELAERSYCPVCGTKMAESGCLSIMITGEDAGKISGNYCTRCYGKWVAANVAKFEERL